LINGIRWRVRAGCPWRDVPACYGPWQTVYGLFRRWQRDGTWRMILVALQTLADAAGRIVWDVSVDSTIARAHQHAARARKRGICRRNHQAEKTSPNRPITAWVAAGAGGPPSCTWAASRAASHWRSSSPPGSVATARSS
jgi:transposase